MAAKKPAKATKAKKTIAKKADSAKKAAPAKKPAGASVAVAANCTGGPLTDLFARLSQARREADGSADPEGRSQGATCARYSAFEACPCDRDDSSQADDSSETRDTPEHQRPRRGGRWRC